MKGGYQIVDLKNKSFTVGVGMVVEGIYDIIEGTNKPFVLERFSIGSTEAKSQYVNFGTQESNYVGQIICGSFEYLITINSNDVVTFTEM